MTPRRLFEDTEMVAWRSDRARSTRKEVYHGSSTNTSPAAALATAVSSLAVGIANLVVNGVGADNDTREAYTKHFQ